MQRLITVSMVTVSLTIAAPAAVYRDYDGPNLPRKQVAFLVLRGLYGRVALTDIDGRPAHGFAVDFCTPAGEEWRAVPLNGITHGHVELLPGEHKVTFHYLSKLSGGTCTRSTTIVVEAGKTYKATFKTDGTSFTNYTGRGFTTITHFHNWWVDIK